VAVVASPAPYIGTMTPEELTAGVGQHQWFHRIDLGHGVVTPGPDPSAEKLVGLAMPDDLSGKTVLDIGTFNGFYAFEAERRGAARVVAADYFIWEAGPWSRHAFDFARAALDSKVEPLVMPVEDMSPETIGTFDLVLFMGVLYHAPDPLGYLRICRSLCSDDGVAIVETHTALNDHPQPALLFYPGTALNNDPTNFWGPNRLAVDAMLTEAGFGSVWHPPVACLPDRYTVHAHVTSGRGNPLPVPERTIADRLRHRARRLLR